MLKKSRVKFGLLNFVILFCLMIVMTDRGHAESGQGQIRLITQPADLSKIHLQNDARREAITLIVRSSSPSYHVKWELHGPGSLEGDLTSRKIQYTFPERIEEEKGSVTIRAIVTDEKGKTFTKSVHFALSEQWQVELITRPGIEFMSHPRRFLEMQAEHEPIALEIRSNIPNPRITWELYGPGSLTGDLASRKIQYVFPERFGEEEEQVTILAIVADEKGNTLSKNVSFVLPGLKMFRLEQRIEISSPYGVRLEIKFDYNLSTIKPESFPLLDAVAKRIQSVTDSKFIIEGHTDSQGSESYNLQLSLARAEAVKEYLVSRHKISPDKLIAKGFGESQLLELAETEEAHAINRRVIFRAEKAAEPDAAEEEGATLLVLGNIADKDETRDMYKTLAEFYSLSDSQNIQKVISIFNEDCTKNNIYQEIHASGDEALIIVLLGEILFDEEQEIYLKTIDTKDDIVQFSAAKLSEIQRLCKNECVSVIVGDELNSTTAKQEAIAMHKAIALQSTETLEKAAILQNIYAVTEELSTTQLPPEEFIDVFRQKLLSYDGPAKQNNKYALVIGNSAYQENPLKSPVNDADAIAETLEDVGFSVTRKLDVSHQEFEQAIRDFGNSLDEGATALFYFSGHGLQVDGTNYLLPTDADIQSVDEAKYQAIAADMLLDKLENAGTQVNIVILDACRNNPFLRTRSLQQGLALMSAPAGTLIAYATAPGSVAYDGSGENSPYTKYLLKKMDIAGLKIEELLKQVRVAVMGETGNRQIPWESSSLTGDFYFRPAESKSVSVPPAEMLLISKPEEKLAEMLAQGQIEAEHFECALDMLDAGRLNRSLEMLLIGRLEADGFKYVFECE